MMKIHCSKCGMEHEVGRSQKNAYMFCLGCDQFFKIEKSTRIPENKIQAEAIPLKMAERANEKNNRLAFLPVIGKKLKTAFKKVFSFKVGKSESVESGREATENKPDSTVSVSEGNVSLTSKQFALMDDFFERETDLENPEYVDFLSGGLDSFSADFFEKPGKGTTPTKIKK
ncbi:MAG: hypothetical protein PHH77_02720 [Victivallaceae bacterium]|nr:hypothetical protein [Victivallaceae bacterium]